MSNQSDSVPDPTGRLLWLVAAIMAAILFLIVLLPVYAGAAHERQAMAPVPVPTIIQGNSVITIGVASALVVLPDLGWSQVNAVQLAVDQVNAAGGIDIGGITYTVALATEDGGCGGDGAAAANNLLAAGVVAVVGHTCSGASIAAQPIYAAEGVAMVSAASTSPSLTEQGYTTTFRVITRDDSPAAMQAAFFAEILKLKSAAVVETDAFTSEVADLFDSTFTGLGGAITSRRVVTETAQITPTLTAIMAEDPELIYYLDMNADRAGLFSAVAAGLGMADKVIGWNSFGFEWAVLNDYAAAAGAAAENDYAGLYYRNPDDMPGYDSLTDAYKAANFPNASDEPGLFGAFAYDAAQIILAAIDQADSTNPAEIRNQVAAMADYTGVVGFYEGFDEKGDVIPQWAWMEHYIDGQWGRVVSSQVYLPIMIK